MKIILASSSPYRKKLLNTLLPSLTCIAPNINESLHEGESPAKNVTRLSFEKANGNIICKPNDHNEAFNQLSAVSGKQVTFYTGLCLLNSKSRTHQVCCETFQVQFRDLKNEQITAYLKRDEPYDCAGSFKSESLGIALFKKMQGDDPNTLIGLPMIKLISMLSNEGIDVLTN